MITTFERARLAPPAPPAKGSVVSIGVFDGVHQGFLGKPDLVVHPEVPQILFDALQSYNFV